MADTLNDLTSALQTYVVAPLNAFGLGGFLFDVPGEGMATLSSDITDHYTEDNRALQDHIAIRPRKITLKGYVGELIYRQPGGSDNTPLQQVTQKLTEITAFIPQITAAATQVQQAIDGIDGSGLNDSTFSALIPPSANIYGLVQDAIGGFGNTARQQSAYQYFAACQTEGVLMGIQTPWEFLTNMAIETIIAIQNEDSIFMTDFAITFKQIRIAQTKTATLPLSGTGGTPSPGGVTGSGVNPLQSANTVNQGICPGVNCPTSLLPGAQQFLIDGSSFSSNAGIAQQFGTALRGN